MLYSMLARAYGPDVAATTFEDAREKAGKELARKDDER
jgi:hypothetical protein